MAYLAGPPPISPTPVAPPPTDEEATALDITLVVTVLIVALLLQEALKHLRVSRAFISGSGACMLLGMAVNLSLFLASQVLPLTGQLSLSDSVAGSGAHDVIYYGLLPPIIFEAGWHMRKRNFFANIGATLGYALAGTLIAVVSTGALVYAISQSSAGMIKTRFTLAQSMVFGSLISSTDPVATLGILKNVNAAPLLNDLIFGESALNDALSIVFFNVFLAQTETAAAPPPMPPTLDDARHQHHQQRQLAGAPLSPLSPPRPPLQAPPGAAPPALPPIALNVGAVIGDVFRVLFFSFLLGLAFAVASALVTRFLCRLRPQKQRPTPPVELALVSLFALLSFTASDRVGFSGILSLFVCSIVMRHYTFYNLSSGARDSASVLFSTVSETCETCLAVLIGVAVVDYLIRGVHNHDANHLVWDVGFLGYGLLVLLVARALNIILVSACANLLRKPEDRITWRAQLVMWFAGMRGAVSFALAITLPSAAARATDGGGGASLLASDQSVWTVPIVTTTLGVVLVTNLLMAPLTGPLIRSLDLMADETRRSLRGSLGSFRSTMGSTAGSFHLGDAEIRGSGQGCDGGEECSGGGGSGLGASLLSSTSLLSSPVEAPAHEPVLLLRGAHGCECAAGGAAAETEVARHAASRDNAAAVAPPPPTIVLPWTSSAATSSHHHRLRGGITITEEGQQRSAIHRAWRLIDQSYIKPYLGGRQSRVDDQD